MKELLILKDIKDLEAKKGKSFKKPSGIDFASLLFDSKSAKNVPNLLVMQNTFKAKNSIINKDIKTNPKANLNLVLDSLNKQNSKKDANILANLLQNPTKAKVEKIMQNAKEINEFLPKRLQISEKEILQDITKSIENADFGHELLDDLNFVQVLDFLDILKQDKKDAKLHDFFNLKKIVNNKVDLESFANTKSIHSLVELAKEHKLGIKNITYEKIKNNEYNEEIFKKPYPKLYEQNFFSHSLNTKAKDVKTIEQPKKINLESILNEPKPSVKTVEQAPNVNVEKTLKTGALNDLLSEVAKKETKEIKKEENIKSPKITKEENIKPILKEEIKEAPKVIQAEKIIKDLPKAPTQEPVIFKEIKPENIAKQENQTLQTEEIQTEVSETKEVISEKPNNNTLQSLKADFLNPNKELTKEQTKVVIDNFTRDFKEEIEKFKAPSHRVSINLNPKELGEINVTMIARGNNLHINLNSANQNTLNLFIANQQEFKNSLVNMGFTGLAMNFGDKKEGSNQEQNQKNARKKYEEIEELEATSDMPSGINAILYRYL